MINETRPAPGDDQNDLLRKVLLLLGGMAAPGDTDAQITAKIILALSSALSSGSGAASKSYADSGDAATLASANSHSDANDLLHVLKSGDTMTGALTISSNAANKSLTTAGRIAVSSTSTVPSSFNFTDASTGTTISLLAITRNTTGVAATGIGSSIDLNLDSSTTASQLAARLTTIWTDATHATRTASVTLNTITAGVSGVAAVFTNGAIQANNGTLAAPSFAARNFQNTGLFFPATGIIAFSAGATELLRLDNTKISFFGATTVVQQASAANLTNNVTVGGTTDTIANFTDLVVYANDAATIRNDIYQLSRKLKQVNDALRAYGLLT